MKQLVVFMFVISLLASCKTIESYGKCYQNNANKACLQKVVDKINIGADKADIKKILGEPIDSGFDYRYLIDEKGENGCAMGAVFHFDKNGKVDQKWLGEICE